MPSLEQTEKIKYRTHITCWLEKNSDSDSKECLLDGQNLKTSVCVKASVTLSKADWFSFGCGARRKVGQVVVVLKIFPD